MDHFTHRLKQAIARAQRHKTNSSAFLHLALAEDCEGQATADTLDALTRCEDTLLALPHGRIGLILEDVTHLSDPLRVAKRLREAAPKAVTGIAIISALSEFKNAKLCLAKAEATLQKLSSRGQILNSEDHFQQLSVARLQLESELKETVDAQSLVVYYQPIFNLDKGTLAGFEALVRWDHPTHGLLLPPEFLTVAELRGHMLKIDEFVLKQALQQISLWNAHSDRPIYVSVNLASEHFLQTENLTTIVKTLNAHPTILNLLRVDINETVLFEKKGIDSLHTLDMLKIGFNLDDFGVDSKSFHCLGSFPFNSLKIDRTLIAQMEDEVNAELIVAVLRIAKRMGMKTIAEGVVTHAQLEELRNLGCTEAQGFLFSKAVDAEEAGTLINTEYRW